MTCAGGGSRLRRHPDPGLRGRQPWKAADERDYGWLGKVLAEHYAGNDTNVGKLMAGILAAYDGISVEEFEAKSDAFFAHCAASDPWPRVSGVRVCADGRVARSCSPLTC